MNISLIFLLGCGNGDSGSTTSSSNSFPTNGADPLASYQWHLKTLDGSYVNGGTPAANVHINLGSVHNNFTGKDVKVIISDGQLDLEHPELDDNADNSLSKNYSLEAPYFGDPFDNDDEDAHATGVASIALGGKDNGVGGFGVAPEATFIGYNFLSSNFSISRFIDQAQVEGGEGVFNNSYGPQNCRFESLSQSETYLNIQRSETITNNNLYVIASGNEFIASLAACGGNSSTYYFGNSNFDQDRVYANQILVAATNAEGRSASYSTPGANVWISAPGGDLSSTSQIGMLVADLIGCDLGYSPSSDLSFDLNSSSQNPSCAFFSGAQGTSYAAPVVSGAIAILKEANPTLSWRDIKHILATTAFKIHPSATNTTHPAGENLDPHVYQFGWVTNSAGYNFHPWYGFGLLDLTAAVALAVNPTFDLKELKSTDTLTDSPNYSASPSSAITDNSASSTDSTINVNKHNLFIEHVLVKVNITHPRISDLGIELESPEGTTTKLMNINSRVMGANLVNIYFGVNAFYGERSLGNWTLKVVDGKNGLTGTFSNWSLTILGNKGPDSLTDTTPPAQVTSFSGDGSNLTWIPPGDLDIARYEICIAPTSSLSAGCRDGDWRSVLSGTTSISLESYVIGGLRVDGFDSGENYTAKIRVIDSEENESAIVTSAPWNQP